MSRRRRIAAVLVLLTAAAPAIAAAPQSAPTVDEARRFIVEAEQTLLALWTAAERASWVQATYITGDTEILAAQASARSISGTIDLVERARRFDGLDMPPELARKFKLLKLSLTLPAPADREKAEALTRIAASMEGAYSRAKFCPPEGDCLDLQELGRIMAESRDPAELRRAWEGWRAQFPSMKEDYARFVELSNEGARELGFADVGAMWRSKYDMTPEAFRAEADRLWEQVRPLYVALHAYVRARLVEHYGAGVVPPDGPIPADLLGNMWAQTWANVYPLVRPADADPGFDLTATLQGRGVQPLDMVRYGERFFESLGFSPLPDTFWERSLFTKPADRDVVCHASAWDIDWKDDLRLKMCIQVNAEDFATIHHELGHNVYQRAYSDQPALFRDSANDAFHEAVGDTIALSVTPSYLVKAGLLDAAPPTSGDIGLLLGMALDKVAFLPFGKLIDQWRWEVFDGSIPPSDYNSAWWALRLKFQGVAPPEPRPADAFDPGAKYHVPANVPYTRYFLATVLQFQFHRALCREAGYQGPLYRCSIYDSAAAGEKLRRALEMGQSRPWQEVLFALTGERRMDASALFEYFAPLKSWLDEHNRDVPVGW